MTKEDEERGYTYELWPQMPDGEIYNGKDLWLLLRSGSNPFKEKQMIPLLIQEIESELCTQVMDIPLMAFGCNNFGLHLALSNQPDVMVRIARANMNVACCRDTVYHQRLRESEFEAELYELLGQLEKARNEIKVGKMIYYRHPRRLHLEQNLDDPKDIVGRKVFVFEKKEGRTNAWAGLNAHNKDSVLKQKACIRATLFHLPLPHNFVETWLLDRLMEPRPDVLAVPISPAREFCMQLLASKVKSFGNRSEVLASLPSEDASGDRRVGSAKASLLRLIPHILPRETNPPSLYRFVLEHEDFGVHNITILDHDSDGRGPEITSLFDWERANICPALLSDPTIEVGARRLVPDMNGNPSVFVHWRTDMEDPNAEKWADQWSKWYFQMLYATSPEYERVVRAGGDARFLWHRLKYWEDFSRKHREGFDGFFSDLGQWADKRWLEIGQDKMIMQ